MSLDGMSGSLRSRAQCPTWLTTIKHFDSCTFHIHWQEQNSVRLQNLHFNEFVTETLMPPMHLTYPTASAAICNTIMFSPIDTSTLLSRFSWTRSEWCSWAARFSISALVSSRSCRPSSGRPCLTWMPPVSTDSACRRILCDWPSTLSLTSSCKVQPTCYPQVPRHALISHQSRNNLGDCCWKRSSSARKIGKNNGRNTDRVRIQFPGASIRGRTSFLDSSLRLRQTKLSFFRVFMFTE